MNANDGEVSARPGTGIEAHGVRHVYKGGTEALRGVDLRIGAGLYGLLGPNGAGKSTFMRILCTLLEPTEGQVTVAGHDVRKERRAVRAAIGYLPQEFGAWRLQRVEEALDTLALLSGLSDKTTRRKRVAEVLEQVGLSEVADRKVKKLSGGMVRRLGVAQALVHEPPILIVDEPTVGLDPEERLRFRQLMARLGEDRTILLSTHIVADLGSGCRDLSILDRGEIVYRGSPADLVRRAEGLVFEKVVAADAAELAYPGFEIVSRSREGVGIKIRGVATDGKLPEGAAPAGSCTLEEAYLAFMASRGRAAEIRTEVTA